MICMWVAADILSREREKGMLPILGDLRGQRLRCVKCWRRRGLGGCRWVVAVLDGTVLDGTGVLDAVALSDPLDGGLFEKNAVEIPAKETCSKCH